MARIRRARNIRSSRGMGTSRFSAGTVNLTEGAPELPRMGMRSMRTYRRPRAHTRY